MEIANLNKRLDSLNSKCEDIKHEKKMLVDDYRDLLHQVKKMGIVSASAFLVWAIILQGFSHSNSPTLQALGGFLTPWCIIVFFVAFIPLLIKGYDCFLNADNQYAKKLARKLDKVTLADRIDNLNMSISRLDTEIQKIQEQILERGGTLKLENTDIEEKIPTAEISTPTATGTANVQEQVDFKGIDEIESDEYDYPDLKETDDFDDEDKKESEVVKKNDISDIFSGLDDFDLFDDDDEDEFENSSDLWEKEVKKDCQ